MQRNLALELVRVTEAAALSAGRWYGKGDKNAADQVSIKVVTLADFTKTLQQARVIEMVENRMQAAVDMMRRVLNTISMDGVIVIGEGEKDEVGSQQPAGSQSIVLPCLSSLQSCSVSCHDGL